jgi:hypothetical protein
MKTIEDFKKDNEKMCIDLKTAAINGGKLPTHIETNHTNLPQYGGSDTETWTYDGGMPISGTITDSEGNDHKVL